MAKQRLQKVLASAGIDSRRKCEELILAGSVTVNGKVVEKLPAFVDPEKDRIAVNGQKLSPSHKKVYFLLNKPKGVICTSYDPQGRVKATDLIRCKERIFCIGRLDVDSTGLIILTNDTELANKLTHPRYGLTRTYLVEVKGRLEASHIEKLKKGVWLAEGKVMADNIKILHKSNTSSFVEITVRQGINRQIRRMLAAVGLKAKSLKRTKIGRITSKGLGVGKFRRLSQTELEYLKKITQ
jgi:23S rRNA pseudouridine2605 synthase